MVENKQVQEAFDEFDSFVLHLPEDMEAKDVHGEVSAFIQQTREKLGDVLHEQFLEAVANPRFDTHFVAKNEAVTRLAEMRQEESARKLNEANQTISGQGAEINRHNAEAAETKRKADEAPKVSIYTKLDISDGIDDQDAHVEWENKKEYVMAENPQMKVVKTLDEYIDALQKKEHIDLNNASGVKTLPLTQQIDSYYRVKYLTELPVSNEARLPPSKKVQNFLRTAYYQILKKIQSHLTGEQSLNPISIRYLTELGIDVTPIKNNETLIERMSATRTILKDSQNFLRNSVNKVNLERMVDRIYGPIKREIEESKTKAEKLKESSDKKWERLKRPFGKANIKDPLSYPKGLLWDWSTKPVSTKAMSWMSKNKAETIGGLIGTGLFPGLGTLLGVGAVRVFKKLTADK